MFAGITSSLAGSAQQGLLSALVTGWSNSPLLCWSCVRRENSNKKHKCVGFYWNARSAQSLAIAPWVKGVKKCGTNVNTVLFLGWEISLFYYF